MRVYAAIMPRLTPLECPFDELPGERTGLADREYAGLMFADSPGEHGYQAVKKLFEQDVFRCVSSTRENFVHWPDKSKPPSVFIGPRQLLLRFRDWHYWVRRVHPAPPAPSES